MKITTISYGRTFNNGNYEASRIDLTAEIKEKEDIEDAFEELFNQLEDLRNIEWDVIKPKKR